MACRAHFTDQRQYIANSRYLLLAPTGGGGREARSTLSQFPAVSVNTRDGALYINTIYGYATMTITAD